MDLPTILQTYSAPVALLIWGIFKLIDYGQARGKAQIQTITVDNKQDDTLTNFSIKFEARNEQLAAENKEVRDKLHAIELEQAEQKGRETAREEQHERDRQKWEKERAELVQQNQNLDARIQKLEAQEKVKDTLVSELEADLESKRTELAAANETIAMHVARIAEQDTQIISLTSELEKERYKSQGLSDLVEKINKVDATAEGDINAQTLPLPPEILDQLEAEDTYVPPIEENTNDVTL